jgi:hypothetical protein
MDDRRAFSDERQRASNEKGCVQPQDEVSPSGPERSTQSNEHRDTGRERASASPTIRWRVVATRVRGRTVGSQPVTNKATNYDRSTTDAFGALLNAIADALVPRLLPHIRDALAADHDNTTRLMTARDTPSPRATMEACRRGKIHGARKVHRRWMFSAAAWRRYVETHEAAPTSKVDTTPSTVQAEADTLDDLRRELGFAPRAKRAASTSRSVNSRR